MENTYISERVVNMSDCEGSILSACTLVEILRGEVEKREPSMPTIDSLSKELHKTLLDLKYFEFQVERRKTVGACL